MEVKTKQVNLLIHQVPNMFDRLALLSFEDGAARLKYGRF
jgi:hypothetical protein